MKKILSFALCLGLVAASFASCTSKRYDPDAETTNINDIAIQNTILEVETFEIPEEEEVFETEIDFEYVEETLKITKYTGEAEELEIPTQLTHPDYGVLPVKAVGDAAFLGNETLKKVIIPEGIETIGVGAFQSCPNLADVVIFDGKTIPAGTELEDGTVTEADEVVAPTLKTIKANAFNNSGLVNINIPKTVTSIGQFAFSSFLNPTPWYEAQTAEKVIVGDGILLKYNGKGDVTFGEEVKHVAYYAFRTPGAINVTFNFDLESFDAMAVYEVDGNFPINFRVPFRSEAEKLIDSTPYSYSVHGVPTIDSNPFVWEITTAYDTEGSWYPNCLDMDFRDGALHGVVTGADPIFSCEDDIYMPAESFHTLKIRMKHKMAVAKTTENAPNFYFQVFYNNGSGLSEGASVKFNIEESSGGEYIDYEIDMTGEPWKDIIEGFRIDPPNGLEGEFWIDRVEFVPDDENFDYNTLIKPFVKKIADPENPYYYKFNESESQVAPWGMTGFEYSYAPIKTDGDNDSIHGILDASVESAITSPVLNLNGVEYRELIVRMRSAFDAPTAETVDNYKITVYFDNGEGYSEDRSASVDIEPTSGEEKIEYTLKMYKADGWYNNIKSIKVVLPEGIGGEFWIDKFEFVDEDKLSKADFIEMLYEADGGSASGESFFYDVVVYDDYCNAVVWAAQNGFVTRALDNMFYPDSLITYAEYAKIMNMYAAMKGSEATFEVADETAPVYEMDAEKAINAILGIEEEPEVVEERFIDLDAPFTWTFKHESELSDWSVSCLEADYVENALHAVIVPNTSGGYDPILSGPSGTINADEYKTLKIKLRYASEDAKAADAGNNSLQVYFDNGSGLSEANSVKVELVNTKPEEFVEYTLDMGSNEAWTGNISFFRIDPSNNVPGEIWLESVAFEK